MTEEQAAEYDESYVENDCVIISKARLKQLLYLPLVAIVVMTALVYTVECTTNGFDSTIAVTSDECGYKNLPKSAEVKEEDSIKQILDSNTCL